MADCIFCRIVAGEIPAKIAKRTPEAIAFHDLNPQAPVHLLVVPVKHLAAVREARSPEDRMLVGRLLGFATEVATELGLDQGGYRLVTNTGGDGGQTVDHLHFHLLGGRKMGWPPG
ncbi:MAG: histidine triad nucleotide-binding protein [Gemmatimonadales bacterium]